MPFTQSPNIILSHTRDVHSIRVRPLLLLIQYCAVGYCRALPVPPFQVHPPEHSAHEGSFCGIRSHAYRHRLEALMYNSVQNAVSIIGIGLSRSPSGYFNFKPLLDPGVPGARWLFRFWNWNYRTAVSCSMLHASCFRIKTALTKPPRKWNGYKV